MEPYAEVSCILKVNLHCQACKMRILEVLGSICGEYNIDINSEEGLVKIYALVDPNLLMKALSRTGYHAELVWAKLQHPRLNSNYYGDVYESNNYPYGSNYGSIYDPYGYNRASPRPLPYSSYNYPAARSSYPYPPSYHGSDPYYCGSSLPQTRYVPSYPPVDYGSYADERISLCSVM